MSHDKMTAWRTTTGIDYLGTDGSLHRAEAGTTVTDLDPKAARWMARDGFVVPAQVPQHAQDGPQADTED